MSHAGAGMEPGPPPARASPQDASASAAATTSDGAKRDNTTPSCAVCQRRKVKCNRVYPCAPCLKTGLDCYYKTPQARHRKRVKRSLEDDDHVSSETRSGAQQHTPPDLLTSRRLPSPIPTAASVRLLPEHSGYRYVNNHLWSGLPSYPNESSRSTTSPTLTQTDGSTPQSTSGSTPHGRNGDISSDGNSFVFSPMSDCLRGIEQPTPGQIVQLWQIYIANVDPIMKVLHHPTVQQIVLGQIGQKSLPSNEQALVSAIYLCSVVSLTDEQCQAVLNEPRDEILARLRRETEAALSAAGFITTADILVLQAVVLYLAALKSRGEAQAVWSLNGLAIRIAGTMGLARDGETLNLTPFDTEIRRRLWWTMVHLDARMSELVGQDADLLVHKHDVRVPTNVNDSDLWPNMTKYPEDRAAATELVYVNFRSTLSAFLTSMPGIRGPGTTWKKLAAEGTPKEQRLEVVQSLENRLQEDIIQYCDRGVPLQMFTVNSADTVLSKMRLVAHLPDTYVGGERTGSGRYSEDVFQLSMRIMQLQLELFTEPCLQRFRWHSRGQFQWAGLAYLIRQTRLREPGPVTSKAWAVLHRVLNDIMPTIEFGPRKVQDMRLIESIRHLLNTASQETSTHARTKEENPNQHHEPEIMQSQEQQQQQHHQHQHQHPHEREAPQATYPRHYQPQHESNGRSRPHNAMLPGLMEGVPGQNQGHGDFIGLEEILNFDPGAIDWQEFDRLTAELMD